MARNKPSPVMSNLDEKGRHRVPTPDEIKSRKYINKLRKIRKEREAKALALRAQDKSNNKS